MEHWVYGTDDDELPNTECWTDVASKQQHAALKRKSAECTKTAVTAPNAVTNAPGDPSWWQLIPSPEKAQPLPRTYQHKQPDGCAPDIEEEVKFSHQTTTNRHKTHGSLRESSISPRNCSCDTVRSSD